MRISLFRRRTRKPKRNQKKYGQLYQRQCPECGVWFTTANYDQVYNEPRCRTRGWRRRKDATGRPDAQGDAPAHDFR